MKLYIAEKPSLGRAIADALPKPHRKAEGCIYVGTGDCVSWCIGHLLEQAEPDAYNPEFKQWRAEHLPIVPDKWQLKPITRARKQLAVLRQLIKQAEQIVHAGDPDREGQLLVDQVIDYLKVSAAKRAQIQRLLIADLNPAAINRALRQLKPNREFAPLSISALARARADWLYGINMTRTYTLQGRKVGYQGVLSVGRVQTPVLGLVVARDRQIEAFQSKPFYQVVAHIDGAEPSFKALWQPSDACQSWMDEDGRVLSQGLAENVAARIGDRPATVSTCERKPARQPPPLAYNLSSLQIDAAKRFKMSAQQVLDTCQSLYEKHKLLTYPRSDCRYLPEEHYRERGQVLAAIAAFNAELASAADAANSDVKSRVWNDAKVGAHHAIIPTAKAAYSDKLTRAELNIYQLVARQYLAQFYPPCERVDSHIELEIGGGCFIAKAREITNLGWKALLPLSADQRERDAALNTRLPKVQPGELLHCTRGEVINKQTSPPKPFDDASLLAAMTGIARFVKDAKLRKILTDSDGLGTEATRAGIIELLFKRDFLARQGRSIIATSAGRALIDSLPEVATSPDMTAHWEMQLNAISRRTCAYGDFIEPLTVQLKQLVDAGLAQLPENLRGVRAAKPSFSKKRRSANGRSTGKAAATKRRAKKVAKN